jgi:hypothetical protein
MPANGTPEKIRERLTAELADIRSRKDLSEDGRRRQLARVKARADQEVRDLARANREALETRKQELVADLVANPTAHNSESNMSYRAARAQAATLRTPGEAAALLREARMARDGHLERAVAMWALDRAMGEPAGSGKWAGVVNEWSQHQPSKVDEALTELSEIQHQTRDTTSRIASGMRYALPPIPELAGQNVARLAQEADENPGEAERDTTTGFEALRTRPTREQIFGTHYTPEAG